MVELSVVLVMVVRDFDFENCYEEFDRMKTGEARKTYRGGRAYLVEEGAAHPADGYPCRVSVRGR